MGEPLRIRSNSLPQAGPSRAGGRLVVAGPDHPLRGKFEALVEARFAACFAAHLRRHYPRLVGLTDAQGAPRAVAGVRFADEEPLFLERYLDAPVDAALGADRRRIVEIGSLATEGPCAALALFGQLAGWLAREHGRRIAVATLTPRLERLLGGAGFALDRLAAADPARLGEGLADWGGYYRAGPAVFAGEIPPPAVVLAAAGRRRVRSLRK